MKDRMMLRFAVICACFTILSVCADGQQIRGTVTDPSGAVIPGVTVRLLSGDAEIAEAKTDTRGSYSVRVQQNGCVNCQIICSAAGFKSNAKRIVAEPNQDTILNVELEIEVAPESVSVEAKGQAFRDQLEIGNVRESTAKDVGEALTQIEGVYKIRKAGIANDVVVRGFQQNNINVLIDGARIYGACPGHMDPSVQHVDFAEVEKVEIDKGAFNVNTAGSLGATVNVATKKPPLGVHFTPSSAFGSYGFYNPGGTASFGNMRARTLVGYSYRTSGPYKDGSGTNVLRYANYSNVALNQPAFDIHTGWFEAEFVPTPNHKLTIGYTRQQSGTILYPYLTMDADYDNADRAFLAYSVEDAKGAFHNIHVRTYYTQVIHLMSNRYRTSSSMGTWTMLANARSRSIGGQFDAAAGKYLTFGFESFYRNWNMMGYSNMGGRATGSPSLPDVETTAVGAFSEYRRAITDRLRLSGGVRFDHAAMAAHAPNLNTDAYFNYQGTRSTSNNDSYASGNMRVSYTLPRRIEVFAGVGSTGRIPDAEERYINRRPGGSVNVGDPKLPVVRNTESTAGLVIHRGSSYVKPTLFYSNLSNYIVVNNQPLLTEVASPATARSYTNVDARIYGAELSYALLLPVGFSLNGGGSYSKGCNDRKPQVGVMSVNLPEMPPLRTWAALRYTHKYSFLEVSSTAVARQDLVDQDLNESVTAGYGLMNVKFGLSYRKLNVGLAVDNVLNHYFYEHLSYYRDPFSSGSKVPEPGRNFFAQLKYMF